MKPLMQNKIIPDAASRHLTATPGQLLPQGTGSPGMVHTALMALLDLVQDKPVAPLKGFAA
ncbi:hypothetical protein N7451_004863 [Penicillium sp. IBT 35674x]|nr:hypothetical protein N7451_004863 [Penicillium sp. IBT 35674x]